VKTVARDWTAAREQGEKRRHSRRLQPTEPREFEQVVQPSSGEAMAVQQDLYSPRVGEMNARLKEHDPLRVANNNTLFYL
jgi:hypothetical protein